MPAHMSTCMLTHMSAHMPAHVETVERCIETRGHTHLYAQRAVDTENAHSAVEVAVTQSKGDIEVAAFKGRAKKEELVSSTRISCEAKLRAEEQDAAAALKEAEATRASAVFLAKAREAEAEGKGTAAAKNAEKVNCLNTRLYTCRCTCRCARLCMRLHTGALRTAAKARQH